MPRARVIAGNQIIQRLSVYAVTIFSFVICLLACFSPALGSDVLRKVDVLENLNFNSFAYDGRHFVFTRYDATGNKYELGFYDLKKKKLEYVIPDLSTETKFLFANDRLAFVIDRRSPNQLIIIEKESPSQRKTLKLDNEIIEVFTIENRLYVIQHLQHQKDLCLIYNVATLAPLTKKEIEKSKAYHLSANKIVGIGNRIIVYDQELNPVQQIQNELQCQLGMSGMIKDRLFFSDICGKIYEYKPEANTRSVLFDMGMLDLPSRLHSFASLNFDINNDGLLVAVHSNKESDPKLVDTKSGRLMMTLTVPNIPDHIMLDENMLYFIFSDWLGKKSKIEVYSIDNSELYSDEFYSTRLIREHERALGLYRDTKDFYRAVEVLESADIVPMIKGERRVGNAIKTNILNDYAYFLSLTYDRYKEAIPLLEQVIALSPERASAYLNIADSYYKLYQYDKNDSQVVEKATAYYEQYMELMIKKGAVEKALKRAFPVQHEEPVVKSLTMAGWGGNIRSPRVLLFLDDKILVATDGSGGPAVEVYDRDDYAFLKHLETIENDEEQQDNITSLTSQKDKLFVATVYRYEDKARPNLFVYDLVTFANLGERHEQGGAQGKEFFGLDTSPASNENAQQLAQFIRSGRKFERLAGNYETNNNRYLITSSADKEKKFHVYDLIGLNRYENIDLARERANFYLFEDFDKLAITYFTSSRTLVEIYDIKNNQRRQILSLENDSGGLITITPRLQTYKHYLIVTHREDLIFFDAKNMEVTKVIKHIIPESYSNDAGTGDRIETLAVDGDKKRLLVFTLLGRFNRFLDLTFLE